MGNKSKVHTIYKQFTVCFMTALQFKTGFQVSDNRNSPLIVLWDDVSIVTMSDTKWRLLAFTWVDCQKQNDKQKKG